MSRIDEIRQSLELATEKGQMAMDVEYLLALIDKSNLIEVEASKVDYSWNAPVIKNDGMMLVRRGHIEEEKEKTLLLNKMAQMAKEIYELNCSKAIVEKEAEEADIIIGKLLHKYDTLRQCIIDRLLEVGSTEVFGNYDNEGLLALLVREKDQRLQKLVEARQILGAGEIITEKPMGKSDIQCYYKLDIDDYSKLVQAIADAKGEKG